MAAEPSEQRHRMVADGGMPGLSVRISNSGSIHFIVAVARDGVKVRQTLEKWPALTLAAARIAAQARLGSVAATADPVNAMRAQKAAAKAAAVQVAPATVKDVLLAWGTKLEQKKLKASYRKQIVHRVDKLLGADFPPFVWHDFRRIAATRLQAERGPDNRPLIDYGTVDLLLAHVMPGSAVSRGYLRHDPADLMAAAWNLWGGFLAKASAQPLQVAA